MALVDHEVADRWRLEYRRTQACLAQRHAIGGVDRGDRRSQPLQRLADQLEQGAHVTDFTLLAEQRGDVVDTIPHEDARVRAAAGIVRQELHRGSVPAGKSPGLKRQV